MSQLAVQLYTLRDYCKTPADIASTLKKLADQGWRAVQASALGPHEAKELKKMLDDNGLACIATHKPFETLRDKKQEMLDYHATLGCAYTAIGGFFPKKEDYSLKLWSDFARDFGGLADSYAGTGLAVGYHNHSHEWASVDESFGAQRIIDLLMQKCGKNVWWEIDTYWVAFGGGDPAAWIDRVAGNIPCVHLKDLGIKPGQVHYMMEVGQGNLNWPRILEACKKAGVKHYIVEQDTCYRDPFDSLKTSLENLRAMGMT